MKILFVCTGNTCRSPMAEYIFRQMLKDNNIENVEVSSCGVACSNDNPISENSYLALKEINIDASAHKSKSITIKDLLESDYIFTMTDNHKSFLKVNFNAGSNVQTLGEAVGLGDITDPFGSNLDVYRLCRDELKMMLSLLLTKLFADRL